MPRTVQVYDRTFPSFSRVEIHPRVSELLQALPRGTLLDLPAGSGSLSYRLHREGFQVTACDILPERFLPKEIPFVRGDLSGRFPFNDATFDYACFVEGPEHAQNPLAAFQEFGRVVKPGGRMVVTLPNYGNMQRRLKVLFLGSAERAVSRKRFHEQFKGNASTVHVSPLAFPLLRFFLEHAGFEIERIEKDKTKTKQLLWYPLALFIQLVGKLGGQRTREGYWVHQTNSNRVLLGGNTIIVQVRKTGGPPGGNGDARSA
jgi:SAM-dependent methyltransferase